MWQAGNLSKETDEFRCHKCNYAWDTLWIKNKWWCMECVSKLIKKLERRVKFLEAVNNRIKRIKTMSKK